jgi:uncharacterized protein (TIGR01777 family)
MKIVIAGGSGFIGESLCSQLLARGHDVVVLSRDPSKVAAGRGVAWDAKSQGVWSSDASDADAIVNLSGENIAEGRWTDERKRRIVDSRLNATRALVEALRGAPAKSRAFVSASAIGYYGPHGDEELDESAPAGADFLASICGQWEEAARTATPFARLVIVRIGIVLAKEGGALSKMLLPFRLFAGGKFGSGKQWMSWITRDDLVRLFVWAIENDSARDVYNATSPNPVRNEEFTKTLGRVMHRPALAPAPAFALRIALGEMADALLLSGQRVVPRHTLSDGFRFEQTALEPALRQILVT